MPRRITIAPHLIPEELDGSFPSGQNNHEGPSLPNYLAAGLRENHRRSNGGNSL
ncbi:MULTISPECIES: hypothetical protein [unclassified Microcoleus]|uniref:hypothetical protein n=1 Tax=unclassified Microcoleus TaxID=2642155 RepID=UPI0040407247